MIRLNEARANISLRYIIYNHQDLDLISLYYKKVEKRKSLCLSDFHDKYIYKMCMHLVGLKQSFVVCTDTSARGRTPVRIYRADPMGTLKFHYNFVVKIVLHSSKSVPEQTRKNGRTSIKLAA